jgi:hypothetical protein
MKSSGLEGYQVLKDFAHVEWAANSARTINEPRLAVGQTLCLFLRLVN